MQVEKASPLWASGRWFSFVIAALVGAIWAAVHLLVFPERIVPLTYLVPMLVCIWTRSLRMLWGMALVFAGIATLKIWILAADHLALHEAWTDYLLRLSNVGIGGLVIHAIMRLRETLENRNTALSDANEHLSRANEEIACQNEELNAQSEELAQQNEELRSQGEELEQQSEELGGQAEELHALNDELARRERVLEGLLAVAGCEWSENSAVQQICRHGLPLLGSDVTAAGIVEPDADVLRVKAYAGEGEPQRTCWPLENSLAGIVIRENRTACLEDVSLRPDLVFPSTLLAPTRSVLATPLRAGRRTVGAIEFYCSQVRSWSQDDFRLAEWIAHQCSPLLSMIELRKDIQEREQRFRTVFERAAIGIAEMGLDGSFLQANSRLCEITGYTCEQLAGKRLQDITHPDDMGETNRKLRQLAAGEIEFFVIEKRYVRPDGSAVWVNATKSLVRDEGGRPAYYIALIEDISERKGAEASLRQLEQERAFLLEAERTARTEAERVNRIKDEFLATVSHELRSPLNAIVGWTQLMARGKVDAGRAAEVVQKSAKSLTQVVEDMLDMGRIISGKVRLSFEPVNMEELITGVIDSVRFSAEAKSIRLETVCDPQLEPLECDPNRVQQIIWNLLTNAVKFTQQHGRVRVEVEQKPADVVITVSDTGQGIAGEFLPHIFDRFRQQDGSITRKHGGLGLGLSITKSLVDLHSGSIEANSAGEGQGATFTVTLPHRRPAVDGASRVARLMPVMQAAAHGSNLRGLRILAVDDAAHSRELLEQVLTEAGATVCAMASAEDALSALREFKPDILISDVGMPGRDGYSFVRAVRSNGFNSLPCLAVTAMARPEDRERALAAGFDDHLPKPYDPNTLTSMVDALSTRSRDIAETA